MLKYDSNTEILRFSVDVFVVDIPDVGKVWKIKLQHDNSGSFGPGWYLTKVCCFCNYSYVC